MRPSAARSLSPLKRSSLNGKAAWRKKPALVQQLQRIRSLKQKDKVKPKAEEAAQKAEELVNKGAYNLGVQLSKTRGMFSNFKDEYKKALEGKSDEGE